MKTERQNKIVELIETYEIDTQEELVRRLQDAGCHVTQATVSRDIKELKLIKMQNKAGLYSYALPKTEQANDRDVLTRIFRDTVLGITYSQNLVIIKTLTGSANAAAELIDNMQDHSILGTIAGDNTIFVAMKSEEASRKIAEKLLAVKNN